MTRNETILQYLTSVPAWYLATSVNDQPHVRPFSFAAEQDGKYLVLHSNHQRRVARACGQPQVRGNLLWPGHGWLILRGRAGLVDGANDDIRRAGFEHLTSLGETYTGPDDPTLVFFSAEDMQAWICNHDEWKPL